MKSKQTSITKSDFVTWFIEQHGPRVTECKSMRDHELMVAIRQGRQSEKVIAKRNEWSARFESALYAWQAAQKKFNNTLS